jgi:hypothetical protein
MFKSGGGKMKGFKIFFIFVLLSIVFINFVYSQQQGYPWPMRNAQGNFNGPLSVSATLGDYRGSQAYPRFHRGIDIAATGDVFSLVSGAAHTPDNENYVYVGDYYFGYVHLTQRWPNGWDVTGILDDSNNPTRIGVTSVNHLHLQIGRVQAVHGVTGPFSNPLDYIFIYNNQNYGPHPYNYTDPNDEHGRPIVYSVNLFREYPENHPNSNRPEVEASEELGNIIYGLVEIRGRCRDRQYSANIQQYSGIYIVAWCITDMNNNLLYGPFGTIRFDRVEPPDNGTPVKYVYDVRNSTPANSEFFYYWITNPIINNQVEDRYWNTKLRRNENWNGGNARINSEAQYPDGIYKIWVLAYDTSIAGSNGGDTINRRGAEDEIVVIDNFSPYITQVLISNKYSAYWGEIIDSLNLGDLNVNREDFKQDELQNLNIILSFSEIMNTNYNPEISLYFESSKNEYRLDLEQGNWNNTGTIFNGNFRLNQNLNENDTGFVTLKIRNVRDLANNTLDSNPKTIEFYENFYL